jgi:serine O-acetyltransferase
MEVSESSLQKIKADIRIFAAREGSAATASFVLRMYLLTPGFQFVMARRLQEIAVKIPLVGRPIRKIVWWMTCLAFGSELALGAEFGGGLYVPHPYGIVVGVAQIGRNVAIMQNVTIGKRQESSPLGTIIRDNVDIGAGAVVLGPLTVGENTAIGANSVVLADVPAGSVAIGVPARIIARRSDRVGD